VVELIDETFRYLRGSSSQGSKDFAQCR